MFGFLLLHPGAYCAAQRYGTLIISEPKRRIDPGLNYVIDSGPTRHVKLPRLTRFPDTVVMRRVNADLEAVRRSLQNKARKCRGDAPKKSDWNNIARVDLLTRDVLSIYVGISQYCGGAYPSDDYIPLTYNMRTGKRFDFQRDAAQLFKGEISVTEKLLGLYLRHYGPAGDCNVSYIRSDTVSQLYLHFASNGLVVNLDLPHVMAACGPEIVIPYSEIQPLVKPDNPFASLITPEPPR